MHMIFGGETSHITTGNHGDNPHEVNKAYFADYFRKTHTSKYQVIAFPARFATKTSWATCPPATTNLVHHDVKTSSHLCLPSSNIPRNGCPGLKPQPRQLAQTPEVVLFPPSQHVRTETASTFAVASLPISGEQPTSVAAGQSIFGERLGECHDVQHVGGLSRGVRLGVEDPLLAHASEQIEDGALFDLDNQERSQVEAQEHKT